MCDGRRALLAAVFADPGSDLPRLVYADWLDDRGEHGRADLIRWQLAGVELARVLPAAAALFAELAAERGWLVLEYHLDGVQWEAGTVTLSLARVLLPRRSPVATCVMAVRRGFAEELRFGWRE